MVFISGVCALVFCVMCVMCVVVILCLYLHANLFEFMNKCTLFIQTHVFLVYFQASGAGASHFL